MPQPDHVSDGIASTSEEEIQESITAKRLRQEQNERQTRRKTAGTSRGSSSKTSVWSTLAATVVDEGMHTLYHCAICGFGGKLNKGLSNSNIIQHYRGKHRAIHDKIKHLDDTGAAESQFLSVISTAHRKHHSKRSVASLRSFFKPRDAAQNVPNAHAVRPNDVNPSHKMQGDLSTPGATVSLTQSTCLVLYGCAKQLPLTQVACPMLQGLVHLFGGRMLFSSRTPVDQTLFSVYRAVCRLLKQKTENAMVGCVTADGWSSALRAPILGITWHFVDSAWRLRTVPIATRFLGDASKTGLQLCAVLEDVLHNSPVVGSDKIKVHTCTTDNEAAAARAADLLTNFVGSIRCVVHTISLAVQDGFTPQSPWQKYLDVVNQVTTYFRYHSKAEHCLNRVQLDNGVTSDRIQRLKHDIHTRWHSRLAAMKTHMGRLDDIVTVVGELEIPHSQVPIFSEEQQNTMAEFIVILDEVRRVSRQLEADRTVTMSRAPRLLKELYETLLIISGNMQHTQSSYFCPSNEAELEDSDDVSAESSHARIPSIAESDSARDVLRKKRLTRHAPKQLAIQLANRFDVRLGHLWRQVDEISAEWRPDPSERTSDGDERIDADLQKPRRALLFHIAAVLDINECEMEFIDAKPLSREQYIHVVQRAVVREAVELDDNLKAMGENLNILFGMLHDHMRSTLKKVGRKHPSEALTFWRKMNTGQPMISPRPFNNVAKAFLASQASSAASERLFSDLGQLEGSQSQSQLSSTLEMRELIRMYVLNEIEDTRGAQTSLLHPEGNAFKRLVTVVANEIVKE